MCNLYAMTTSQQAIREIAGAMRDRTGNLPPLPAIFPDYAAPIVRNHPEGRELTMARWGMPSPVFALKGRNSDPGVTNVRNVASPHWRRWLGVENRCIVPFTSFSENETLARRIEAAGLVRAGRDEAAGVLRRHLDPLDLGQEGQRRRDDQRHLRLPDDRAEPACRRDPPQGDAGDPDDARGDRPLDDRAHRGGASSFSGLWPTTPSGSSAGAGRRTREASRPDVASRQATRSGAEARRPADPSVRSTPSKAPD